MSDGNTLGDFPAPAFSIRLFCDACGHQANLDRNKMPDGMTIQELRQHLRCTDCGSRECSIRIIYTGAGGYHHVGEIVELPRPTLNVDSLRANRKSRESTHRKAVDRRI